MATLRDIEHSIRSLLQERLYEPVDMLLRINTAVSRIAAGIKLPDGRVSPPLPELADTDTVATELGAARASLPATYGRGLHYIADSNDDHIKPPSGGDYYSYNTFLRRAQNKDLSEAGTVYMACVQGTYLYYQGIPATSEDLLIYFYRKPVAMTVAADGDPDGIPEEFQLDTVKHYVLASVYGDNIGRDRKINYKAKRDNHLAIFYETIDEMMQYIGEFEGEPTYFYSDYGDY